MTATTAEALELALWLHRAPARRTALLGRPLPDGIGQLLRVASGAKDQLADAARITGEDEATVLEAVRFYLQQILFQDEADAYRILGLRPDAAQSQAREHHRLLQQWLHPDRSGGDAWESVYATRINRAWGQLRTPQARAAYDAALGPGEGAWQGGARPPGDYQVPAMAMDSRVRPGPRNGPRYLTYLVLLGCAGLLVLIAVRQEAPPEWSESRATRGETVVAPEGDETLPRTTFSAVLGDAANARVREAAPEAAAMPPPPAPAARPAAGSPATPVLAVAMPIRQPPTAPVAVPETGAARPPRPAPLRTPVSVPSPAIVVAPQHEPSPPIAAAPEPARIAPSTPLPPLPLEGPVDRASPAQIPDAFGRMSQAQSRARAVLAYLGDPSSGLPPVWNDTRTMQQAERIRAALHGRRNARERVPVDLQSPQWRLTADGARLESRYRAGFEQGRIGLGFTWRENQLLVDAISLDPEA